MHLFNNIPLEMRQLPQWVCWRKETRDGHDTKIPYDPKTGRLASTTNPLTWAPYDKAVAMAPKFSGIGFVFSGDDGLFGLDMDGHIDQELIDWFSSYAERSQSGTGCHIIGKGKMPFHKGKRCDKLELYSKARYFCMTGDVIRPEPIAECQEKLDELIRSFFSDPDPKQKTVDLSAFLSPSPVSDILLEIRQSAQGAKFDALWRGDISGYPSGSEADAALLSILRFWTYGDESDSIALFKQSGLMRLKAERPDYLPRTWATLTGDVRQRIESLPVMLVQAKGSAPWRKVTIEHVAEAIKGTILETLAACFCAPTNPPLPLEVGIAKALPLCGCALSGRHPNPTTLAGFAARGVDAGRIRIMTAGGMVSNFWTLLVGESASGKDVGGLVDTVAHQFKWSIGTSGSEEGIADAYVANPIGLLSISEMKNWLDERHWQGKAAGFLTPAFNKGHFSFCMSRRGEGIQRSSEYCFPNIAAAVQPGVLEEKATKSHVDTGFLGRFLVLKMPKFIAYPVCRSLHPELQQIVSILKILSTITGEVIIDERYNEPLNDMFDQHHGEPASSWKRLSSEYYPRLSLLLSTQLDNPQPAITADGWARAEVLVKYLFNQAESVFGGLCFDSKKQAFESMQDRILSVIKSKGGKCLKSQISYLVGRGSNGKERQDAINELEERSRITVTKDGKATILSIRHDVTG